MCLINAVEAEDRELTGDHDFINAQGPQLECVLPVFCLMEGMVLYGFICWQLTGAMRPEEARLGFCLSYITLQL